MSKALAPYSPAHQVASAQLLTGAEAAAQAMRQINPDVVPVYPITPQTPIVEGFAQLVADGLVTTELINVESEHSAMSAAVGSALAGARTMTATSSQGLALMVEVVYIASAMRAPVVMSVANRALSGPLNIHCDHSDSMLARDSGAVQLFAQNAQEVYDLTILAPRLAEDTAVLLPVLVCQDGFILTHSAEPVHLLDDDVVREFVGPYRLPQSLLEVDRPATWGPFVMPDHYFEFKRQLVDAMQAALRALQRLGEEFASLSGRAYGAVEPYRLEDASHAVVLLGSTAGTVKDVVDERRAAGDRVGLLTIRSFRPFPHALVHQALAPVAGVAVLDRALAPGSRAPLFQDVAMALRGEPTDVREYVYGLGGRDLQAEHVHKVFDELARMRGHPRTAYLGLRT